MKFIFISKIDTQQYFSMSLSIINISETKSVIEDLSFEQVKQATEKLQVSVKEKSNHEDLCNLYMLVSDKNGDVNNSIQSQCNGLIIEKESNKVVGACYNKIADMSIESFNEKRQQYSNVKVEYCEDGTMMRLYNYNDNWYTATARCMDARDSIWTSDRTFDELFWEVFDKQLLTNLNKSYTYVFLLLHTDNRIVVRHLKNELVYVSRIHNETQMVDEQHQILNHLIRKPHAILDFDVTKFNEYCIFSKRGLMFKCYDKDNLSVHVYKTDFDQYAAIKYLRGNVPLIRMRFLELLHNQDDLMQFEMFYQEHAFMFAAIKHALGVLVQNVYTLYVESHIKHNTFIYEPHPYYKTLRQLHAQYKATRVPISYNDVRSKIFSLDKNVIRNLLGWVK